MFINEKEFKVLSYKYSPLIKWMIESNQIYTNIDERIRWCFVWDDDSAITATVNRKTNGVSVNLSFVDEAYNSNRLYDIEYFLLHEMRHVYQHIQIRKYKNRENDVGDEFIELWIKEGNNYSTSIDKGGNENIDYYRQDCELDAYAFSFVVMHIKYHGIYDSLLFVPETYKNELKEKYITAVNEFKSSLQDEGA